jgi:hypothetical protein
MTELYTWNIADKQLKNKEILKTINQTLQVGNYYSKCIFHLGVSKITADIEASLKHTSWYVAHSTFIVYFPAQLMKH